MEESLELEHKQQPRPKPKWGTAIMLSVMTALLLCSKAFALYFCDTSLPEPYEAPPPYGADMEESIPLGDVSFMRNIPVAIYFTGYETQCDVYPVGLTQGGAIDTMDTPFAAAWYMDYAAPGEWGNCIINGHDYWKNRVGHFSVLKRMQIGDEVVVEMEDGNYMYYKAVSVDEYSISDFPAEILQRSGDDRLTLITCQGEYSFELMTSPNRMIVVCEQVNE